MREVIIGLLSAVLLLTGCSGGEEPRGGGEGDHTHATPGSPPPVRGDIDVSAEPLALADLPETPEPGTGVAVLGEETYPFAVTFCDEAAPIGEGSGEGVAVAWDIQQGDGDHRVSIRLTEDSQTWVRGGPVEAEWDEAAGTVSFAGAFVPFRAEDGSQAQSGGIVVTCPAEAA